MFNIFCLGPQEKIARYEVPQKRPASHPSPVKPSPATSKFYPKSLSIKDILRLGRVVDNKAKKILIYKFDFAHMEWSSVPLQAEFGIEEKEFAAGGFRKAFKATSITEGFNKGTWVVKSYLESAVQLIKDTGQTTEEHTRKSVQMQYLARNFASQLKETIAKDKLDEYGDSFEYKSVYMGKTEDGELLTVEEFIPGDFAKFINNNGIVCEEDTMLCKKAQAFSHFTYEKSEGKVMVLDIQGSGYTLYDPEIASAEIHNEDGGYQFCTGNLAGRAIESFFEVHQCNSYCKLLKLKLRPS